MRQRGEDELGGTACGGLQVRGRILKQVFSHFTDGKSEIQNTEMSRVSQLVVSFYAFSAVPAPSGLLQHLTGL